ncbi:MAG: hypothetical protein PHH83_04550 [Patescibacteria group bacterium]|nr:hypothetical protein [Patescibacteria group bacterium]
MNIQESIKQFLGFFQKSHDAGLIIFDEQKDFQIIEKEILNSGFSFSKNFDDLVENIESSKKTYIFLKDELDNKLYEFISQYSTGQINIYDGYKNIPINPNYERGGFLILINFNNLQQIEEKSYSLLSVCGLTWRNKL